MVSVQIFGYNILNCLQSVRVINFVCLATGVLGCKTRIKFYSKNVSLKARKMLM